MANIKNMHYDFKQKLNRIDSNKYIGLQIPQIDWKLNEGLNLYILLVAEPRIKNQLGFETAQRTTDDIAILVVNGDSLNLTPEITPQGNNTIAALPSDYGYYVSSSLLVSKDGDKECAGQKMDTVVIRHDNRSNIREFYNSNFEWRECNIRFFDGGIRIFNDDGFNITDFSLDYIKTHPFIQNSENFNETSPGAKDGTYTLPDGTIFTEYQDCLLPERLLPEVVDLAVMLTTGDLELPMAYQFKRNRLQTKQLIV